MIGIFRTRRKNERGVALVETALTLPLLLLVSVSIFEFGRAYQTWQVLTNAAREGARIAVLPGIDDTAVKGRVQTYMTNGQLDGAAAASVTVDRNKTISIGATTATASEVSVSYPFDFIVLKPVAQLVVGSTTLGESLTMKASATMRNE